MKTKSFNIMKYLIVLIGVFVLASCELNDAFTQKVKSGPNIVMYKNPTSVMSVNRISNGDAYKIGIKMWVGGPHMKDVSGDISFSLEAVQTPITEKKLLKKDATLAVEGVNFTLPSHSITLKESNNYLGQAHFIMLTKGIRAPLDGPKILKLKVTNVSGDESVIGTGRILKVALNYSCASYLAGVYKVIINGGKEVAHNVLVTKRGVGKYTSNLFAVFGKAHQPPNFFTRGVKFKDVCGVVSVPKQTLANFTGIDVKGRGSFSVNGDSQVPRDASDVGKFSFKLQFTIVGYGTYTSVYIYQGPLQKSSNLKTGKTQNVHKATLPLKKADQL